MAVLYTQHLTRTSGLRTQDVILCINYKTQSGIVILGFIHKIDMICQNAKIADYGKIMFLLVFLKIHENKSIFKYILYISVLNEHFYGQNKLIT